MFRGEDLKRRDSVTKKIYATCRCAPRRVDRVESSPSFEATAKYFNDERDLCELNKFDAMMQDLCARGARR